MHDEGQGRAAAGGLPNATAQLAASMLEWITRDGARLEHFMALSGHTPASLVRDIASPALLEAALRHLMEDEPLLLQFCADTDTAPEECARAWQRLQAERMP